MFFRDSNTLSTVRARTLLQVTAVLSLAHHAPTATLAQGSSAGATAPPPLHVKRIPLTDPAPPEAAAAADAELAKRPWLLERLIGPEKSGPEQPPLIRLNPPQRPAALGDPPSAERLAPRDTRGTETRPESSRGLAAGSAESHPTPPGSAAHAAPIDTVFVEDLADDLSTEQAAEDPAAGAVVEEFSQPAEEQLLDYTGHPISQPQPRSREAVRMHAMMKRCLDYYFQRPEIADERSNWGMMHAIMVYGIDTPILVNRQEYNAIAWIAGNNACRGQRLLAKQDGRITAENGVGLQGHQAQFLAVLAMAGVPADYALYAGQQQFTVHDLIETEQRACQSGQELTFTLIGLSHYLSTESVWENESGESWDFERLIREELAQPIVGAACGGTHRLMGLAHALRARRSEGLPIDGQWKRADQYLQDFVQYTYRLQNRDGSFSTQWFEGREEDDDLDRKIQTSGHMVEWLLTVTPDTELQNPRLLAAVRFLLQSLYGQRNREWEIGPKGHALRSLAMFYERVYRQGPAWRTEKMAHGSQRYRRR